MAFKVIASLGTFIGAVVTFTIPSKQWMSSSPRCLSDKEGQIVTELMEEENLSLAKASGTPAALQGLLERRWTTFEAFPLEKSSQKSYKGIKKAPNLNGGCVLMITLSRPDGFERRQAIRQTWGGRRTYDGALLALQGLYPCVEHFPEKVFDHMFIIGRSIFDDDVEKEVSRYGDILWIDTPDGYNKLVDKVLEAFNYISKFKYSFVIKIDDDIFLDHGTLLKWLSSPLRNPIGVPPSLSSGSDIDDYYSSLADKSPDPSLIHDEEDHPPITAEKMWAQVHELDTSRKVYSGHIWIGSHIHRDSESSYHVHENHYQIPRYHPYAAGPCYVISGNIARLIPVLAAFVTTISVEDAFIGEVLHQLGVHPRNDRFAHISDPEARDFACFAHNSNSEDIRKYHQNQLSSSWASHLLLGAPADGLRPIAL